MHNVKLTFFSGKEIISCAGNTPCLNGGTCLDLEGSVVRGNVSCICPAGYTGQLCGVAMTREHDDIKLGHSSVHPTLLNTSTAVYCGF